MNLLRGRNGSLRDYINHFRMEALKFLDLDEKVAMIALQKGMNDTFFKRSLAKKAPEDMNALQERDEKYIKAKKSLRKETHLADNTSSKK